jgi:hypothetical protein
MASHIKTPRRAQQLKMTLKSIARQVPSPPPIFMSWSAEGNLASDVRSTISELHLEGLRIHTCEQSARFSQFEHLRHLTNLIASSPGHKPSWVMFSDDDDVWSEQRTVVYQQQISAAPGSTQCLLCRRKAMPRHRAGDTDPPDASAVRQLLARDDVRLTDANARDGLEDSDHNMPEYFDCAVRFELIRSYFAGMPDYVVAHKLCDLAFCFLATSGKYCVRFMPAGDEFVYFYNRGASPGGASTEVTPLPEEFAISEEAVRFAPPPVRALFQARPHTSEGAGTASQSALPKTITSQCTTGHWSAIGMVSGLRMGIEQEVIRLRSTGSVLPLQLINDACSHQAEVAIEARAIDVPEMRRVPGLYSWLEALATGPLRMLVLRYFEFEALVCLSTWAVTRICTTRTAAQILRDECSYFSPKSGGFGARVGMWAGGGEAPPPGVTLSNKIGPPSLFRIPQREARRVAVGFGG